MEDAQGFLGHPEVGFFSMLLIGVIAGWIAEKVTESDHSIFTNILVGIAGSFVGGALASLLQPRSSDTRSPANRMLGGQNGRSRRLHARSSVEVKFVDTSLSPTFAGRDLTKCRL